jgi:hypothetical protein
MMRRQMLTAKRTVTPAQATMRRSQTHLTKEPRLENQLASVHAYTLKMCSQDGEGAQKRTPENLTLVRNRVIKSQAAATKSVLRNCELGLGLTTLRRCPIGVGTASLYPRQSSAETGRILSEKLVDITSRFIAHFASKVPATHN